MKNRNHFLIATSSVVCIAIALTCIFFVPSNKGETLTLNTSLLKDFDWSDTLELSNIYSSVRFLPVSVSKNIRDIEIFDDNALFLAFPPSSYFSRHSYNEGKLLANEKVETGNSFPAGMVFDQQRDEVMIGDNENRIVTKYDRNGNIVRKYNTDFYFIDFNYSFSSKKFIFYTPLISNFSNSEQKYSIVITDESMKPLKQIFPLDETLANYTPLFSNCFQTVGEKTYFAPLLSSKIYEISYDGSITEVIDLGIESSIIKNKILSFINGKEMSPDMMLEINKIVPIYRYWIGDEVITIEKGFNRKMHLLIVQKKSGKSVTVLPSIKITNYGKDFKFAFIKPHSVTKDGFVSLLSYDECKFVAAELQRTGSKIPAYLRDALSLQQGLLMVYKVNFEYLYDHSTFDLSAILNQNYPIEEKKRVISGIKIFPNPSTGIINVDYSVHDHLNGRVILSDIFGRQLYEKSINVSEGVQSIRLDVSNAPNGVYLISFLSDNKAIFSSQVLISK